MIRIAVCGSGGRMGKTILEVIKATEGVTLGAAIEHDTSPLLGQDAGLAAGIGKQDVLINSSVSAVADDFDVLIDFTLADAVADNLRQCHAAGKRIVIGTTGLSEKQQAAIRTAAADIAIVFAPNMSIGVNLLFKLTQLAAGTIAESTDIDIIEAHHKQKKDAPSGTALRLGEIVADALGRDLADCTISDRADTARSPGTIGFETIRAGDIVGEHTVIFTANGERLELKHIAGNRRTFANGAVRAAQWLMQQDKGLFDMRDVLGL
ncbi:MAG: 4-hydroxy-tetrahydrodipicolinate reductase [Gammaproteobacteria bacterium]